MTRAGTETTAESCAAMRLVAFRIGQQTYAIPLSSVAEIVSMPLLSRPPGLPRLLAGFFNLAGVAMPVLRLDYLFGSPLQPNGLYIPLLVLQKCRFPLAMMVESIVGIISIRASAVLPLPENCSINECTEGVVVYEDLHVLLLAPERLLLKTEQQSIADLAALEQTRLDALEGATP